MSQPLNIEGGGPDTVDPVGRVESIIGSNPEIRGYAGPGISQLEDGIYVSPEYDIDYIQSVVSMGLLPDTTRLGVSDSHHEVVFSKVRFVHGDGTPDSEIDVALKSFTTSSEQAVRELFALIEVKRRGFDTFEPLGVVKSGDVTLLVTREREDLLTLDNLDWSATPAQEQEYSDTAVPYLDSIAKKAAELHAKGIFHGDLVAKNLAVNETNELLVLDFEDTIIVDQEEEIIDTINGWGDPRDSRAFKDITHFWEFLTKPYAREEPFLISESAETVVAEFISRFLDPYIIYLSTILGTENIQKVDIEQLRNMAITTINKSMGVDESGLVSVA